MQVAAHEQPIRVVRCFEANGTPMIATGSWDKTVKYWDCRQSAPAATLQCQERVYTMDVRNNLLVVGTADRYINVVNLASPDKFYKTLQSPLKWQTRVVSCFADAAGFAIGSIEGRCAIQYVEDKDSGYVRCYDASSCMGSVSWTHANNQTAQTSPSSATATHRKETLPVSTPSTISPSIPSTAPSRRPARMARSTSGTKTLSTDLRATPTLAAASPRPTSTRMATSSPTP